MPSRPWLIAQTWPLKPEELNLAQGHSCGFSTAGPLGRLLLQETFTAPSLSCGKRHQENTPSFSLPSTSHNFGKSTRDCSNSKAGQDPEHRLCHGGRSPLSLEPHLLHPRWSPSSSRHVPVTPLVDILTQSTSPPPKVQSCLGFSSDRHPQLRLRLCHAMDLTHSPWNTNAELRARVSHSL